VLAETARRLQAANVRVEVGDAARPGAWGKDYDRVLVDPPCTGLGTLQAHPDLRWRVRPGDPERLARLQAQILEAGARALRPGGVLLYSTCTLSATENERLIDDFLVSHPGFTLDDLASTMPGCSRAAAGGAGALCVVTLPHRDRTAGFFMARLRRD
jgi:16S rRNA (cytosine967-C5)-methyltransferase